MTNRVEQRRTLRLQDYDYSQSGAYFVAICTQKRALLLDSENVKRMINAVWRELDKKYVTVSLDDYIIMPNHVHGIIFISRSDEQEDIGAREGSQRKEGEHIGSPLRVPLGRIIQWFKTISTNRYILGVRTEGWQPFLDKLWQRSYYERIVRNEKELNRIREYIRYNPLKWDEDMYNPAGEKSYRNFEGADLCVCPRAATQLGIRQDPNCHPSKVPKAMHKHRTTIRIT